jgi:hypothetical protein
MTRFTQRYANAPIRECSTPGCHRTATSLSPRCYTCAGRLRRFGHPEQRLPHSLELDGYIRRAEGARGRIKHLLQDGALEARWANVVSDCRANAEPSYRQSGRFTHNKHATQAAALVRDIAENTAFLRALDLMTAFHLMNLETRFRSPEAFACSTVELMRRAANVGRFITEQRESNGTIRRSFRKEVSKEVRLEAARLLELGLGAAARELAKLEHTRAAREAATQRAAYNSIQSIADLAESAAA